MRGISYWRSCTVGEEISSRTLHLYTTRNRREKKRGGCDLQITGVESYENGEY